MAINLENTQTLKVFALGGWDYEKFCLYVLHVLQMSVKIIYILVNKSMHFVFFVTVPQYVESLIKNLD